MASRTATATVRGYHYQFDATILKVLSADPQDKVLVEYLEDVSVHGLSRTDATQCKYIPSKKFSDSAIREAVVLMLADFLKRPEQETPVYYTLYAHFSDMPESVPELTLDEFKRLLTPARGSAPAFHIEHSVTDGRLTDFLGHFALVPGPTFEEQQNQVMQALLEAFHCSGIEADSLYYSNALRLVIEASSHQDVARRTLGREGFLRAIDLRAPLYNLWYYRERGTEQYAAHMRQRIHRLEALHPQKRRVLFLGGHLLANKADQAAAAEFIVNAVHWYYAVGKAFRNTKHLTVILDADPATVLAVKRLLVARTVQFHDGYEQIEFSPSPFDTPPVINTALRRPDVLGSSSYSVRVLGAWTLARHAFQVEAPDCVLFFSDKDESPFFPRPQTTVVPVVAENWEAVAAIVRPPRGPRHV